ncbi:hypothetical protein CEXT_527881 [Caerostris extrusa]|uniref:Uncharacterized protein n=1 Tax=Caerostris extrusa TaxID=172846 RepID=A0AAV4XUS3_CAEEX|nr:hypothetical protein CEXT_527881 [Caerostris extrusa]
MIWLEDTIQKRIPVVANTITNKALKVYEKIWNYNHLLQLKRSCHFLQAIVIMGMTHRMEGEGFEDFGEADFVELMEDKELDENDLDDMVNETNDRDRDPDEEESQPIAFI